jgi:CDP-paratose 2-epimerase
VPQHPGVLAHGIGEDWPLDFHSPYGCSKGSADQYVLDYARTFDMPNVVFRMSCIYGIHQCGTEDQGWVAHFLIQCLLGNTISIYGDGRQVRDALYVEDLVNAMLLASRNAERLAGCAFNIGGGVSHTTSLLELLDVISELEGDQPQVSFHDWRIGDQRYYVSDTRRFTEATGWEPRISVREGVRRLHTWLKDTYRAPAAEEALQQGVA